MLSRVFGLVVGSAVLAGGSGGRMLAGATGLHGPGDALPAEPLIDFGVGLSDAVVTAVQGALNRLIAKVAPVATLLARPAQDAWDLVGEFIAPAVQPIQERGRARRSLAEEEATEVAETLLPLAMDLVLDRVVIAEVLNRIDLSEVLEVALQQIDIGEVLDLIDIEEVLTATMQRVDLTEIALEYIDMRRVIDAAVREVDVTAVLRTQLEGMDLADLIRSTPTSLAGGALRQTTRFVRRG